MESINALRSRTALVLFGGEMKAKEEDLIAIFSNMEMIIHGLIVTHNTKDDEGFEVFVKSYRELVSILNGG